MAPTTTAAPTSMSGGPYCPSIRAIPPFLSLRRALRRAHAVPLWLRLGGRYFDVSSVGPSPPWGRARVHVRRSALLARRSTISTIAATTACPPLIEDTTRLDDGRWCTGRARAALIGWVAPASCPPDRSPLEAPSRPVVEPRTSHWSHSAASCVVVGPSRSRNGVPEDMAEPSTGGPTAPLAGPPWSLLARLFASRAPSSIDGRSGGSRVYRPGVVGDEIG